MHRAPLALAVVATLAACVIPDKHPGEIDAAADDASVGDDSATAVDAPLLECSVDLPCPTPDSTKVTLCGRIHDAETDLNLRAASPTGATCAATTVDGPCSLRVRYHDALAFAMNPGSAAALTGDEMIVDDCGRFRAHNLERPSLGFVAIAIDDATGTTDRHVLTAAVAASSVASPIRVYITRHSTDQAWTSSAGLTGQSFGTRGVIAMVFTHRDLPVAGVTVQRNGAQIPADDYYFSNAGSGRTTVMPAQTSTGANGTALVLNSSIVSHSGTGAVPSGCSAWADATVGAIAGAVLVREFPAEDNTGGTCP